MDKEKTVKFLTKLGFDKFEARIYLSLTKLGISSVLDVSRDAKIDRSKVYRRIGDMKKKGIVEEVVGSSGRRFSAVDPEQLERFVDEKVEKAKRMKDMFSEVKLFLTGNIGKNDPKTKILFYRGKEGIRQMIWNVLRAKKEGVGYTYRDFSEVTGVKFLKKWTNEFARRGLIFRDLYNEQYLSSRDFDSCSSWPNNFIEKMIPAKVLKINHQLDIYNDVVSFYNWHEGEVFGVEIYNKKVANLQKQLFELVWGRV